MNYQLINPVTYSTTIEQVLKNRGIDDINHYLNVTSQDNLSPNLLNNIKEAAATLFMHIVQNDHIVVMVDSDCDGYTSSALLLNYLNRICPSAIPNISYHLHDEKVHGIDMDKVTPETKLVVVPDASSNEYEKHAILREKGIDVIVLDHHGAEYISPDAIVVNNQLCNYPTKSLSGVGIVYKFCQYIDNLFDKNVADDFLDIVALGLIGDVMDMRDYETHYLVQEGLAHLRNPFFAGMVKKNEYSLGDTLSPIGVAFYVVPFINAVTRVGSMADKLLLFESMLEWKADEMIPSTKRGHKGEQETRLEQSLRMCTNIKNRQTKEQDNAMEQILRQIEYEKLDEHKVIIVRIEEPTFSRAIVGLIANKIMGQFQKPVLLVCRNQDSSWGGSGRACSIGNFKDIVQESNLITLAQGHQSAFGCAFLNENYEKLRDYFDEALKDVVFTTNYKVDFILPSNFDPQLIFDISEYEYLWGTQVDEPLVAVENIKITSDMITLMSPDRSPTIKITLPNNVACIKFKATKEEYDKLHVGGVVTINLVGRCNLNRYYYSVNPQILITEYEIVDSTPYYF